MLYPRLLCLTFGICYRPYETGLPLFDLKYERTMFNHLEWWNGFQCLRKILLKKPLFEWEAGRQTPSPQTFFSRLTSSTTSIIMASSLPTSNGPPPYHSGTDSLHQQPPAYTQTQNRSSEPLTTNNGRRFVKSLGDLFRFRAPAEQSSFSTWRRQPAPGLVRTAGRQYRLTLVCSTICFLVILVIVILILSKYL